MQGGDKTSQTPWVGGQPQTWVWNEAACLVALLLLIKQLYLCPVELALSERAQCSRLARTGI